MEEARVEAVLGALPQIQEGRGLGEVVESQAWGARGEGGGERAELALNALGFKRSNDAEAHSGGDQASEVLKQEEVGGDVERNGQLAEERAEERREVAGLRGGWAVGEEGVGDGGPEGAALESAGAIGDVVGGPGVGELVEFGQAIRFAMADGDQGEGGGGGLSETGFEEAGELGATVDFTELPGGFESARMGETSRGKGGVGELEDEGERSGRDGCRERVDRRRKRGGDVGRSGRLRRCCRGGVQNREKR